VRSSLSHLPDAHILRFDRPTLIDDLVVQVQRGFVERERNPGVPHEASFRIVKRSLRVIKSVLKEFTTMRMPLGVHNMGKASGLLCDYDRSGQTELLDANR